MWMAAKNNAPLYRRLLPVSGGVPAC